MGERNFKYTIRPFALAILTALSLGGLTGCNSTAQPSNTSSGPAAASTSGLVVTTGLNPFNPTGTTATPTPAPTSVSTQPVIQVALRSVGFNTPITVSLKALNTLQVVFVPKTQDTDIAGTSDAPTYSQFSIAMTVGVDEQVTPMIPNGAESGVPAQQSQIFNFSGDIELSNCTGSDPTCRENVTLTVTQPQYDYYCFNSIPFFCYPPGYTNVYYDHPWHGMLYIQTDDTETMPTIIPGSG